MKPLPIFVGFDQREAVAYHTFCQSVVDKATIPVAFVPLAGNLLAQMFTRTAGHDGSNSFTYSRFLVPYLTGFRGWALFADGDMVCNANVAELMGLRDDTKAVMVVKHDYKTKYPVKYLGSRNDDYPRKNWSSVVLWNCAHPANEVLTPDMVQTMEGKYLHRFWWLKNEQIGDLPVRWNWLVSEFTANPNASLHHYTIGTPCFAEYEECDDADKWHAAHRRANHADQR